MTIQEAKAAFEQGKTVRHESWEKDATVDSMDEIRGHEGTMSYQNGWEIAGEFKTVDLKKAKASYLEAEKAESKSNADAFEQGFFDGMKEALAQLGIDYSEW